MPSVLSLPALVQTDIDADQWSDVLISCVLLCVTTVYVFVCTTCTYIRVHVVTQSQHTITSSSSSLQSQGGSGPQAPGGGAGQQAQQKAKKIRKHFKWDIEVKWVSQHHTPHDHGNQQPVLCTMHSGEHSRNVAFLFVNSLLLAHCCVVWMCVVVLHTCTVYGGGCVCRGICAWLDVRTCVVCSACMYSTCHKLRKSANFRGNPSQLSVKVCAEICGLFVASLRNRLSGVHGIVFQELVELLFGRLRIQLMGVLRTIFRRP